MNAFSDSPQLRFAARALVTAVVAYFVLVFAGGREVFELGTFLWGLGAALTYAVQGLLLPTEPFVGVKTDVRVPENAVVETHESDAPLNL
jgi:hypothetical protein